MADPAALLDRYTTLTGWAEAVLGAGAPRSAVVQRFHRSAHLVRGGVDYFFADRGLSRAVAGLGADMAHVNGIVFPLRTWRLRRALPPRQAVVVQSHSDGGAIGRAPALRLAGRALRGAVDGFLFAADEHADAWRGAGLVGSTQRVYTVMVASTTVEPQPQHSARAALGVHGAPALVWIGRLNHNKDPIVVLDAFERVLTSLPRATLSMLYGTTELIDPVRARIEQSALLRGRVRLVGAVPHADVGGWLSAADIFIVGSHHEGSGYSLMEAMACGATPVVTDIPTFRVLTGGGAVGALWPPGDAAACARAIEENSRGLSETARARVREHFTRSFSWAEIGRRALDIYTDVVDRRKALVGSGV